MTIPEVEYVFAAQAALRLRIRTDEMGCILRSGKLPGSFKVVAYGKYLCARLKNESNASRHDAPGSTPVGTSSPAARRPGFSIPARNSVVNPRGQ